MITKEDEEFAKQIPELTAEEVHTLRVAKTFNSPTDRAMVSLVDRLVYQLRRIQEVLNDKAPRSG